MSYQATPFGGEWNEDPGNLLGWFLQCMGTADDELKARHFVYYLRAGSDADEWFEDLPEEERRSWVIIEKLFRRRWLKEDSEDISIKEPATRKNEPQQAPTHPTSSIVTTTLQTNPLGTNLHPVTDRFVQTNPIEARAQISEISTILPDFSSPTLSTTTLNLETCSTNTIGHEMRSTTAISMQNHPKIEKAPISTQSTPTNLAHSIFGHTNNEMQVYASPPTSNDAFLIPSTLSTSASSSQDSQLPARTGHKKSALLRAIFESQLPTESPALTTIVTDIKTRPVTADFMENCQNIEKILIFTQNPPEPLISISLKRSDESRLSLAPTTVVTDLKVRSALARFAKNHQKVENPSFFNQNLRKSAILCHFNWAINSESLQAQYISPTKHPCNFSDLFFKFLFPTFISPPSSCSVTGTVIFLILLSFDHVFSFQFLFIIIS
jgi:hypothetical protein